MQDFRLKLVKKFYQKNKRLPSYSEMLKLFSLTSKNSIFKIVKTWLDEEILQKENNKLAPTGKFFQLPFLGGVTAGFPAMAEENLDLLSLDEYLVDKPAASFLLQVTGDSLNDIGILQGDMVVVQKQKEAKTGDIVLALIDNQWTLKILQKNQQGVQLLSANKKYPPFKAKFDLQIYGVAKSVMRKI